MIRKFELEEKLKIILDGKKGKLSIFSSMRVGEILYLVKEKTITVWKIKRKTSCKVYLITKDEKEKINRHKELSIEEAEKMFSSKELLEIVYNKLIEKAEKDFKKSSLSDTSNKETEDGIAAIKHRIHKLNDFRRRFIF